MSTFTLAISCLTTSNLPWFMDLTFQVPMQYCSLQHRTLLPSPVTSTAGYCFCFGSIPSLFLELFLHWNMNSKGGTNGREPACHCRSCRRGRCDAGGRRMPWRRAWQPTSVFLPRESHGQRSLVCYIVHRVAESWTQLIQLSRVWHILPILTRRVRKLCTFSYQFIFWWTFRFLPHLGYCE